MERPQLIEIRNGEEAAGTFSAAEMEARQARLRGLMAERGIDHALFTSYHNVNYYGDFLYCAFGRPYGLVVGAAGATMIAANIDGGQPGRRSFGANLAYTDWQRDNFYRAVQRLIPDGAVVGLEFDHVSLQAREKLAAALPGSRFLDLGAGCMGLRMIKSAEEIALIRQGAEVADLGGAACVAATAPGVPEHEVALAATAAMVREIARRFPGAELRDTWTWFQSGINTDGAHNPVTSRRIARGDILSLNCFPMIAGYYTALERTLFAGACDDASLRLWEINCKVHEEGCRLIRGRHLRGHRAQPERDLRRARSAQVPHVRLRPFLRRALPLLRPEAALELREDVETVLAPGMVVSMEPMIMVPEGTPGAGGYREHDILVVTEDGAENVTGFPYGPAHNIVGA